MANLLDPLIKSKALAVDSVFGADFPKLYGGASDKVLFSVGPAWYAQSIWGQVDGIPAGQMTAAPPLSWNGAKQVTTGQIGGGPWIISRHSKNIGGRGRLRHLVDDEVQSSYHRQKRPTRIAGLRAAGGGLVAGAQHQSLLRLPRTGGGVEGRGE